MKKLLILAGLAAAIVAVSASTAPAAPPLQVNFVKHVTGPGMFEGTVDGAVTGTLKSTATAFETGPGGINHVTFQWDVTAAGGKEFTAVTSGIWNTHTGAVVMNGRVTKGYLLGAQVHEEGQLIEPTSLTFAGFLRLLPSTAS